ncbi:MAG: hypothetical protein U0167_14280 [bacterium]
MVQRWVHLKFELENAWANRIWTAYLRAQAAGRVPPLPSDAGELALHITTRLNMLPHLIRRMNAGAKGVYAAVRDVPSTHVSDRTNEGYAFRVEASLKYELLLDVDSLLFELNALCELMGLLLARIRELARDPVERTEIGPLLRRIVVAASQDAEWFETLDTHRNLFSHAAAPYLAVDVSDPKRPDILVMKRNVDEFSDPTTYVRLSELARMVAGFGAAVAALERHLITYLERPVAV